MTLSELWSRFDLGMREPLHVRKGFTDEEFNESDILGVISALSRDAALASENVRAYVEGAQSHRFEDSVIHRPIRKHDSLEQWSRRVFGRRRFGLIVNYAERWNDQLCRKAARFLRPFFERAAPDSYTVEMNLFVGNYGYTPFGVHFDDGSTVVVHLHLGPAPKTMTLWSRRRYLSMHRSDRPCFHPSRIIAGGRSFPIGPRDIFVLPAGCFHVGFTPRFSAGIALAIAPQSKELSVQRALMHGCGELTFSPPNCTVKSWMRASAGRYVARQASLLGFRTQPLERPRTELRGSAVTLAAPFHIHALRRAGRLCLYVRGTEIALRSHPSLLALVARLNTEAPISTNDLVKMLSPAMRMEAALRIIELLYSYGGIEIAPQ